MLDGWTEFTDAGILTSGIDERNQNHGRVK
jgi:hypothetical protein